jgi:hypothetical protein
MKWFRLKGFIILKSSEKCYHVVLDRVVSWSENMRVVAWFALMSHNKGLSRWFLMQCIKGCSTLRVSSERGKPPSRVICKFGEQNESVKDFLRKKTNNKENQCKTAEKSRISRVSAMFLMVTYVLTAP